MKVGIVLAIAAFASKVMGSSLFPRDEEINLNLDVDKTPQLGIMTFTGPAFVGGPNVTIKGTVKQIHEKLRDINPKYTAWDFPEHREIMANLRSNQNTAEVVLDDPPPAYSNLTIETWNCDIEGDYVEDYFAQCKEGVDYLTDLHGMCQVDAATTCERVSCSNSCGIYMCNDDYPLQISIYCARIAENSQTILVHCGKVVIDPVQTQNWHMRAMGSLRTEFNRHVWYNYTTIVKNATC